MTSQTLTQGNSTWVNSARASTSYGNVAVPKIESTTKRALLRLGMPSGMVPGDTIDSAHLFIPVEGALTGSRDVTVQRLSAAFRLRTVNWNNQPGVTGTSTTVTVGAVADGYLIDFDVTSDLQAWLAAGGGTHPGWRITTTDATTRLINGIPGASLVVTYSRAPSAPTNLSPAGDVAGAKPRLTFNAGEFTALQVQIDPTGAFTSPTFDSGTVSTSAKEYDLATSSYGGLASGSTQWRVRVQNGGIWSAWSTAATITRAAWPALSIVTPGATLYDSQTPLDADMTGMTSYRWLIRRTTSPTWSYDSGVVPGSSGQLTPPRPVFTVQGASYVVTVQAWDGVARADQPYNEATVTSTLDYSLVTSGPDTLSLAQSGSTPKVTVTFTDAAPAAEEYVISRGGVQVGVFTAAELLVSGTTYAYEDWTCPPNVPVTYRVQPRQDGNQTGAGLTATITTDVGALFLVDTVTEEHVALVDVGDVAMAEPETAVVHAPEGSEYVVRRRLGKRLPEGAASGLIVTSPYGDADDFLARFEAWRDEDTTPSDRVFRLVVGDVNLPVWLGDMDVRPSPLTRPGELVKAVSFSYWSARTDA